jgi:hypothetical protein
MPLTLTLFLVYMLLCLPLLFLLLVIGKDGSAANWPGTGGRPPLRIPSNKFYFVFVSDGMLQCYVQPRCL